ncbi:hypothetical protein J4457_00740 [Candidatus Woesearchaeota archaeon]|nr:hypothetical protein [Candidatus Woesearchaeota archaeon]
MHFFGKKDEGFVLHYEKGQHIKSHEFKIEIPEKLETYRMKVSALFLPFQLHHEDIFRGTEIQKYLIPYGGDIFSVFINDASVNFFVIDIMGHGFTVHKLAEYIITKAIEFAEDPHVVEKIGNLWVKDLPIISKEVKTSLAKEAIQLAKLGYDKTKLATILKRTSMTYQAGFLTGCQALLDLRQRTIIFENFGHPAQYFILIDKENHKILGIKSFRPAFSRLFPYLHPFRQIK